MTARLARARTSLEGLATGDAFGETFFARDMREADPATAIADAPWHWTDDTAMALSIYLNIEKHGAVHQDELAEEFAARYMNQRNRGYGAGMHDLLRKISDGRHWKEASAQQFGGQGSWGNGAAMRVAPLGAYFADDPEKAKSEAALSAEVTHSHEEGIAGAVAVALAAAQAARCADGNAIGSPADWLLAIFEEMPDSLTRDGIRRAALLPAGSSVRLAAEALGNGLGLSAQDTVPFALWCAAHHLKDFEDAMRVTVSGGGDMDTNCAIVGGIVALSAGVQSIPPEWIRRREPLPQWVYVDMP